MSNLSPTVQITPATLILCLASKRSFKHPRYVIHVDRIWRPTSAIINDYLVLPRLWLPYTFTSWFIWFIFTTDRQNFLRNTQHSEKTTHVYIALRNLPYHNAAHRKNNTILDCTQQQNIFIHSDPNSNSFWRSEERCEPQRHGRRYKIRTSCC